MEFGRKLGYVLGQEAVEVDSLRIGVTNEMDTRDGVGGIGEWASGGGLCGWGSGKVASEGGD